MPRKAHYSYNAFYDIDELIARAEENHIPLVEKSAITIDVTKENNKVEARTSDGKKLHRFATSTFINNFLGKTLATVEPGNYPINKKVLVREKNGDVLQVFTHKYSPIADFEIMNKLKEMGCSKARYRYDYYHSIIEAPKDVNGTGGEHQPLLFIRNSEVGGSKLQVLHGIFRLVCTNGLVIMDRGEEIMNRKHMGTLEVNFGDFREFVEQIERLRRIELSPERVERFIEALYENKHIRKADRDKLPEYIAQELRTQKEKRLSMYTVVNGLTRLANYVDVNNTWSLHKRISQIVLDPQATLQNA